MENIIAIIVGVCFLVMAYLMIVKKKINLLHSYHYKRVKEEDKDKLSVLSGIGILLIGIGILCTSFLGESVMKVFLIPGLIFGIAPIIYYNKGLF